MSTDRLRSAAQQIVADVRARRMLPVILLLIVAIVAIPIVLGHSAADAGPETPVAIAPSSTGTQTTAGTTGSYTATGAAHRAHSTGSGASHDPFVQPPTPSQAQSGSAGSRSAGSGSGNSAAGVTDLPAANSASTAHTTASSVTSPQTTTGAASTTTTTTQTTATSTHTTTGATPAYSADRVGVSFGSASSGSVPYPNLARDAVLPARGAPMLVFLGVARDGRSGIFFLASGVTPAGEGDCSPSRAKCQFLILKPHDYVVLIDHAANGAVSVDTLTFGTPVRVTSETPLVTQISALGARTIAWAAISVPQLRAMSYDPNTGLLRTGKLHEVAAGAAAIPQALSSTIAPIT